MSTISKLTYFERIEGDLVVVNVINTTLSFSCETSHRETIPSRGVRSNEYILTERYKLVPLDGQVFLRDAETLAILLVD